DAWNGKDADAFAAAFAEDGVTIGWDGSELAGRAAIAAELARIFADHEPGRYLGKLRGVRPLGADVELLRAVSGVVPAGQDQLRPELNAQQALLPERRDGRWQVVLYQNTPAQLHGRPDLADQLTAELLELL